MIPRNRLLSALPENDLQRLLPLLEKVPLVHKRVLHLSKLPIEHVYFIEDGLVSVVTNTDEEHHGIEAWLIGYEGVAGIPVILGAETSPHKRVVQAGGMALCMRAADLRQAMEVMPALRSVLLLYVNSVLVQVSQSGACNTQHSLQQRLARWLLIAQDRSGQDDLPLTHDVIAKMLGVRRAGVTEALSMVEATGAIRGGRAHIQVRDRPKLEALTCGCYHAIRAAQERGPAWTVTATPPANGTEQAAWTH